MKKKSVCNTINSFGLPTPTHTHTDVPQSYGLLGDIDKSVADQDINRILVSWNPLHETGVYIRINAISTEFTPKKHGGEKGVAFRVIVETYEADEGGDMLSCAVCQVKVFKVFFYHLKKNNRVQTIW